APLRAHLLKAKLVVLLRPLELLLELVGAMLHLLDHARQLTDLIFEAAHARDEFRIVAALLTEQLDLNNGLPGMRRRCSCRERRSGRRTARAEKQGNRKGDRRHS